MSGFVIGRDPLDEFGGFTLDKGTADGVAVNNAVISDRGYLLGMVVEAAREGGIPVTICGSAVGNPANTLQYLQLGLRSFSVSPQNLIEVKKALMNAKIK